MAFNNITVECSGCGASISLDPTVRFGNCPYCGNCNSLIPAAKAQEVPAVEEIFPANYSEESFRNAVRLFLCSDPDVPDELYQSLSEREFSLNFWPFFRHTIHWSANWSADIGYPDDNAKAGVVWSPGSGQATGAAIIYAPASSVICKRGLGANSCKLAVENESEPLYFQPELFRGVAYLSCDIDTNAVENEYVTPALNGLVEDGCIDQLPGDYQKNLHCNSRIDSREVTLQMIPYWIFVYEYEGSVYHVMQNAVTGAVAGSLPKTSKRKIIGWSLTGAALVITAVFCSLMYLLRSPYDALMVGSICFPTLCAGFLYRDAISRRKAQIKTVQLSAMPEYLEEIKNFEKKFIKLAGFIIGAWGVAAFILTLLIALLIPIWKDPVSLLPPEPKYPSMKVDAPPKIVRLKLKKIDGIQEEIVSEDGESFIIQK